MRTTRAFMASIGAGMSLVAASVTVLFALSAIVAVRGFPGIDPENDVPAVVLSDALPVADVSDAAAATAPAATVAPIVLPAATADPAPARPRSGRRGAFVQSPGPDAPAGTGDDTAPATVPAADGPAAAPVSASSSSSAPAPAPQPEDPVTTAVRQTGQAVADMTQPVAPQASGPVQQVTGTVADTVKATGVGEIVSPLLRP